MAKMDERADVIGASILAQADHESKELTAKANAIRETEIHAFEDEVIHSMFAEVQAKTTQLRVDSVKTISNAKVTAHSSVLKRREELAGMVFAAVKARLCEYAKTPEYTKAIMEELTAVKDRYSHTSSTVYLREADMPLAKEVEAILPGCRVEADAAIRGGWKLLNREANILIDETFDSRLQEQKSWFLLNSGMQIQ
ncbi:V-type ATP synthase subunit E [Ruminococcaceae bacterium OttesenSCG-928-L11]|nr:V-type ATP synthase subunit E [Ruminococcaceae bacterium OttesenSCG-928-L11]